VLVIECGERQEATIDADVECGLQREVLEPLAVIQLFTRLVE